MLGLLLLFWSAFSNEELQVVGAELPAGTYFNCTSLNPPSNANSTVVGQAREDCIKTGWCIWIKGGTTANTCVPDECLKAVPRANIGNPDCPTGLPYQCSLHYITDVHACGTYETPGNGSQVDYDDLYCRIHPNADGFDKQALDKCFYDDLASRPGTGTCGNKPCGWGGGSSTTESPGRYCRASDAQICSDVANDLDSFCECLGATDGGKFCNLHPNCILNSQNVCVEDLCTRGGINCQTIPANQPPQDCSPRYERRIDTSTGELETSATLRCANKDKNKNGNTCFWGLSTKVTTWTAGAGTPDAWTCSSSETANRCSSLAVYNYTSFPGSTIADTTCEVATIPSGWFAGTEICINPGREVPSITGAGMKLGVPSLFAVLLLVAALVL